MQRVIKAVIFDFDGVIADTEPLHRIAEDEIAGAIGAEKIADGELFVGLSGGEFWERVIADNHLTGLDAKVLQRRQYETVLRIATDRGIRPCDGLCELLGNLDERGVLVAVASSSDRFYLEGFMALLGLEGRFGAIVGGDEVKRRKPDPEIYARAAELLGVPASSAAAIEDSGTGIAAANAAGLLCIGYRNPGSGSQDISAAAYEVDTLVSAVPLLVGGSSRALAGKGRTQNESD